MAWLGSVMSIAGSAMGVAGQVADGQAAAVGASYSEAGARQNAKLAGDQGAAREMAQRRQSNALLSAQSAAIVESGTGTGGTNRMIQQQDTTLAELDALNTRYETRLAINSYDNQADAMKPQPSSMQRIMGKRGLGQLGTFGGSERIRNALTGTKNRGW